MADIQKNVKINVTDKGLDKATKKVDNLNNVIDKNNKSSRTLDRNLKGNAQMSANASKNFSKQAQSMQGVLVPAYAEVAARVFALTAAYSALSRAADFQILLQGQQIYAQQTGLNLKSVAKQLQEAAGFMIDFQTAAQGAALGTTAGLNTKQLVTITRTAKGAAAALGRDLTDAYDRLTRGIIKGEPEILDELGIIIRLDTVYRDYADTLGKTTEQLTEFQKLQARVEAVTAQGLKKYDVVGQGVDVNQFARLQASAMDAVKNLAGILDTVFSPVAKFLADSTDSLMLLFAFIGKSLIGKIFPALQNFGEKMAGLPQKFLDRAEASQKRIEKYADRIADREMKSITRAEKLDKLFQRMGKRTYAKNSIMGRAIAMGGEAGAKLISEKSDYLLTSARRNVDEQGVITAGPEKGRRLRAVETEINLTKKLYKEHNRVNDLLKKGFNMIGLRSAKLAKMFNTVMIPGLKMTATLMKGVGTAMNFVLGVANKIMIVFAAFSIFSMVFDWAKELSPTFTKARDAAKTFRETAEESYESIKNTKVELDPAKIVGSFTDVLDAANFKANLASTLSNSFNEAMKNMKFEKTSLSDYISAVTNFIAEVFGGGLEKDISLGMTKDITTFARGSGGVTGKLAQTLNQYLSRTELGAQAFAGLQAGRELSQAEVDEIYARIEALPQSLRDVINVDYGRALRVWEKDTKALQVATQGGANAMRDYKKASQDFMNSLRAKTPYDEMISQVANASKEVMGMAPENRAEFLGAFMGDKAQFDIRLLTDQKKILEDYTAQIDKLEARSKAGVFGEGLSKEDENNLEMMKSYVAYLNSPNGLARMKKNADEVATGIKNVADAQQLFNERMFGGVDIIKMQQDLILLNEKQLIAKMRQNYEDKKSITYFREQRNLELERLKVLENQAKVNLEKGKTDKVDQKQLNLLQMQYNRALAERLIKEADLTKEIQRRRLLEGVPETGVTKYMDVYRKKIQSTALDTTIPDTERQLKIVEYMREEMITKEAEIQMGYWKKITSGLTEGIKNAGDAFSKSLQNNIKVALGLGGEKQSLREGVGNAFIEAGTGGIANLASEGIFGRSGVMGGILEGFGESLGYKGGGAAFADMVLPKTELDVLIQIRDLIEKDLTGQGENTKTLQNSFVEFGKNAWTLISSFGSKMGFGVGGSGGKGGFDIGSIIKLLFADGGYAMGGFRAFANGGMVNKPTLGLVGEGKYNEAVVPLPDGKSIPVIGNTGGNNNNVTVNVTVDSNGRAQSDAQADGKMGDELGYMVSQAVQRELVEQQRPGGLLNQYG